MRQVSERIAPRLETRAPLDKLYKFVTGFAAIVAMWAVVVVLIIIESGASLEGWLRDVVSKARVRDKVTHKHTTLLR